MERLDRCHPNDQFNIRYLEGTEEQKRHLQNLGFVPTSKINIISIIGENMIVQIFDSRIAINSEISKHVFGTILKKEQNQNKILTRFKRK